MTPKVTQLVAELVPEPRSLYCGFTMDVCQLPCVCVCVWGVAHQGFGVPLRTFRQTRSRKSPLGLGDPLLQPLM